MDLASLLISTLSLIISIAAIVWLLAKHFSTHQIQMVPVDNPFSQGLDPMPQQIGKPMMSEYRDLGDPISQDEMEDMLRQKSPLKKPSK